MLSSEREVSVLQEKLDVALEALEFYRTEGPDHFCVREDAYEKGIRVGSKADEALNKVDKIV